MKEHDRSRRLIQGAGIYAIGTFGTKLLAFIMVPLYTYYISTSDMGVYDLLSSIIQMLTPIITLQISDAAYRWIIADEGETDLYIRTTIQVLAINCTLAVLLVFLVSRLVVIPFCAYFAAVLVLSRLIESLHKLLRALKNQKLFALSGIFYSAVFLPCNCIQICVFKKGVVSLFQSAILASILTVILVFALEPRLRRINYFKRIDFSTVRQFYKFSIPLVPNYLNWTFIGTSDRFIVSAILGASSNGILAIAHKFSSFLNAVLHLFTASWQDVSVSESNERAGSSYTAIFKTYYRLALCLLWVIIPLTKVVILLIMSKAYKSACDFVAFYYLGTVFQSFSSFYGVGYLRSKETGRAFRTSIYGALINAAVHIGLIKFIGLHAAAISTFAGFLVTWIVRAVQNRDELGIRLNVAEFAALTLASVVVSVVSIYVSAAVNGVLSVIGLAGFLWINRETAAVVFGFMKKKLRAPAGPGRRPPAR